MYLQHTDRYKLFSMTTMISNLRILFIILIFSISGSYLTAAPQSGENTVISENNTTTSTLFESLQRQDVLNITIEADLTEILEGDGKTKYQAAKFTYEDENGEDRTWDIEIRQRGKSRRRICDFPPLKLRFDKDDLASEGLQSFHTLKLVTHCLDDAMAAKEAVLREYLAYRVFNQITDTSFRVQLVRITYRDTSGKMSKRKRYGVIIENKDELAARVNGEVCDCMNIDPDHRNSQQEANVALFQYLIGNQDWDTRLTRNIKYIQPNNGGSLMIVPYDFDFSGFVDVAYAIPNPDFGLQSVRDRIYLGNSTDENEIKAALTLFDSRKAAIYDEIKSFKRLDRETRSELISYLDSFFNQADYNSIISVQQLEVNDATIPTRNGDR